MIQLVNKETNMVKECPTGYSWTTFFFGVFVPLIRGDLKWFAVLLILSLLVAIFTCGIGTPFVTLIFAFFYNKLYIKEMIEKGYVAADDFSSNYLLCNGYILQRPVDQSKTNTDSAQSMDIPSQNIPTDSVSTDISKDTATDASKTDNQK